MKPRPAPASTAPFLIAGLCAAIPLLFLSAAAPGGEAWKWLEYPRPITVIACALALIACRAMRCGCRRDGGDRVWERDLAR
ncbi:MAG: hypothetical protein IPQ07_40575 [Myxococcales bacterium]|nr:hypothetical protein [Myxococcales bacterium]